MTLTSRRNLTATADYLSAALQTLGFDIMSQGRGNGLPLVAFKIGKKLVLDHDEFAIAHELRQRGWVVPAYTMAPHSEKLKLMRVVVREDFSRSRCDALIKDFAMVLDNLKKVDNASQKKHQEQTAQKTVNTWKKKQPAATHFGDEQHSLQGKHDKTHPIC
jgi:glutamate decarboxylase